MKLVEQHIIKQEDPRFQRIDEAATAIEKSVECGKLSGASVLHL